MNKQQIGEVRQAFAIWKKTLKEPLSPSLSALSILLAKMIEFEDAGPQDGVEQPWKKHFHQQLADRKHLEELGL